MHGSGPAMDNSTAVNPGNDPLDLRSQGHVARGGAVAKDANATSAERGQRAELGAATTASKRAASSGDTAVRRLKRQRT